jgi:hypothetical protein
VGTLCQQINEAAEIVKPQRLKMRAPLELQPIKVVKSHMVISEGD